MKYSYMLRQEYKDAVDFDPWVLETDLRFIEFRNQYGERFVFTSLRKLVYKWLFMMLAAMLFGWIIGKVL